MENETMIEIRDLTKVYKIYDKPIDRLKESLSLTHKQYSKEFFALNGINLTICKGESMGILGRNGSGKSTLLKIITGVLSPTSGSVTVHGKISALLELGAGFNPEYTGLENIYLNGTMMGYSREEVDIRIEDILQFADIGDFIHQPIKTYSSGMFARLAFAVAINVEPEILIIDEVLAVGDSRFQMKCIEKMRELKEKGTTILFVSHATEQVKRFCDKAVWIQDGIVHMQGESSQIVDLYENYMKYGECGEANLFSTFENEDMLSDFPMPEDDSIMAAIMKVEMPKTHYKTFDTLIVDVTYEIYDEKIETFLLGVAIYTSDRKGYIFGPNTFLDKDKIPQKRGRHKVQYVIPKLLLLQGSYAIDVGLFTNEGIVMLDYRESICSFDVSNLYFSEGQFYMEHLWKILK